MRFLLPFSLLLAACAPAPPPPVAPGSVPAPAEVVALPGRPSDRASSEFWETWGDGRAEMSGYRATTMRYGAPRASEVVLIYVTEPHDRSTWVKDDEAPRGRRVNVLKLNHYESFQTGIYPYSVMTSVFSPVDGFGRGRFQPVKLTLTAQEWCGHTYHALWPGAARVRSTLLSYFASEGERSEVVEVPEGTLYEDALLIQLRELDGPFAGGATWQGRLVPTLWQGRVSHQPLRPVPATITRADTVLNGAAATRFTLQADSGYVRTFFVEQVAPRRVLAWETSTGDRADLLRTERLPYWTLNGPGDERYRAALGLSDSL